ncbi:ribose 5-phosphate isomerase B [Geofilum rubicundum]|uniref:Ribose 5-phosphate isomerase B n=1 Tax=Geofilum rubicundum JCM 15548 TaxID=1236989 RepID=A0A0E9M1C8_9BACT|nr:ribose 5-phosphate isomerase B [Geofilum rubicundum]GAO31304.1 ribose 5-phosphate isomerase B [Geofilum rubicundum JCM 15548]
MSGKKIAIGCDHAGFELKQILKDFLLSKNVELVDFGTHSSESVDYADYAHPLADAVERKQCDFGITICGSGNGINMTVNKHQGIRAALCWIPEISRLARAHNDANVCSLPGRFVSVEDAKKIVDLFLETPFEGGRHTRRIEKISTDKTM